MEDFYDDERVVKKSLNNSSWGELQNNWNSKLLSCEKHHQVQCFPSRLFWERVVVVDKWPTLMFVKDIN